MNYLKGNKTKITNALSKAQDVESYINYERDIELNLWANGDLVETIEAKWFDGDYTCLETLNKQVSSLVKSYDKIELVLPHEVYEFHEITIFKK